MYKEIRLDLASQRATLSRVHLNQMLTLPLWDSLPTSGELLQFCRSMRKRRRELIGLPLPDIEKLETWSSQGSNAILLIDTYNPLIAKTFTIDLIDLILESHLPIIWLCALPTFGNVPRAPQISLARWCCNQCKRVRIDYLIVLSQSL